MARAPVITTERRFDANQSCSTSGDLIEEGEQLAGGAHRGQESRAANTRHNP